MYRFLVNLVTVVIFMVLPIHGGDPPSKYQDVDPNDPLVQKMAKDYVNFYEEAMLSQAWVDATFRGVIKAKSIKISVMEPDPVDHDFSAIFKAARLKDHEIHTSATVYILSVLMTLQFRANIYQHQTPFPVAVTIQTVCKHIRPEIDFVSECDIAAVEPLERFQRSADQMEKGYVTMMDLEIEKVIPGHEEVKVLEVDYQNITDIGNGTMLYISFQPKFMEDMPHDNTTDMCLAAVYNEDETYEYPRLMYIDKSCYIQYETEKGKVVIENAFENPHPKSATTVLGSIAVVIMIAAILVVLYFVGIKSLNGYHILKVECPWDKKESESLQSSSDTSRMISTATTKEGFQQKVVSAESGSYNSIKSNP